MELRSQELSECGRTIDEMIAELTNVSQSAQSSSLEDKSVLAPTVFLYGRPHGFAGPTLHKAASVWLIWKPWAKSPAEKVVTLIDSVTRRTREGDSPDHLIEIPAAHAMVLDIEEFVLSDEHVERVRRRIAEQRGF